MNLEKFSKPVLRMGLSLVLLWFGFQQITSPENWAGFIPQFIISMGTAAKTMVIGNAIFELTLGLFLITGLYTRFASALLGIHILGITISMGMTPTGIRDFGLFVASLVIFLNGPDKYCLDKKFEKNSYK